MDEFEMMVEVRLEMMREEWIDNLFNEIYFFDSLNIRQISWGYGRSSNEDDFVFFEIEADRVEDENFKENFKEELVSWLRSAALIRSITIKN